MTEGPTLRVLLLTRPGCHLCADARAVVAEVCTELGVGWAERDVTAEPQDLRYVNDIPVTIVDGKPHDFLRVSPERLRRSLR